MATGLRDTRKARPALVAVLGLLLVATLLSGCRSGPPETKGVQPEVPDEVPVLSFPDAPAPAGRTEMQQRYWSNHGIALRTFVDSEWRPLGEPVPVSLVIQNRGSQTMQLPMHRRPDIFDDPTVERGQVYLEVEEVRWSARWGQRRSKRRERVPAPEQMEVPAGNELRLQFEVAVPVDRDTDLVELNIQGFLFPLAVRFEGEPDRFVAMSFPARRVRLADESVVGQWGIGDWTRLEQDRLEDPRSVLGLAVMYAEMDRIRVTDWLIAGLPGRTTLCRTALLMALEEVTGQGLGQSVSRWKGWWESERGATWARQERERQREETR